MINYLIMLKIMKIWFMQFICAWFILFVCILFWYFYAYSFLVKIQVHIIKNLFILFRKIAWQLIAIKYE